MSAKLHSALDERLEVIPASAVELTAIAPPTPSPSRDALIAIAAYYRAERRGFAPGSEMNDWLSAEQEVLCDERPL